MTYFKIDELVKQVKKDKSDLALQALNNDFLKIQYFDHAVDWHTDSRDEFFICLDGVANFELKDQNYILHKGDMIIIESGKVHRADSVGSILLSVEPHEKGR